VPAGLLVRVLAGLLVLGACSLAHWPTARTGRGEDRARGVRDCAWPCARCRTAADAEPWLLPGTWDWEPGRRRRTSPVGRLELGLPGPGTGDQGQPDRE
jgi:hypothetical protein